MSKKLKEIEVEISNVAYKKIQYLALELGLSFNDTVIHLIKKYLKEKNEKKDQKKLSQSRR